MAAIVYLDVDDEITSAAARIRALDEERIALVLPLGSRLATSRINFRLLAREAEARGKRIEVVTNDASARALAASAGLPTHVSVAAFERGPSAVAGAAGDGAAGAAGGGAAGDGDAPAGSAPAGAAAAGVASADVASRAAGVPPPFEDDSPTTAIPSIKRPAERAAPVPQVGRRPPTPKTPIVAAILLLVGLIAASITAAFLVLPSADIRLTPASDTIGPLQLSVTAQNGVTQPDPVNLLVPATRFTFDVDASDTFPATGVKVDETAASGEVTFQNCDNNSVKIPRASIVGTPGGIRFATQEELTLKKATFFPFLDCPTAKVSIQAMAAGPAGNVGVGQITQIPAGFDPDSLRVTNEQETAGGTHTETQQIQQADVDSALTALQTALAASLDEQIAARTGVPEGTILFPETKSIGETTPSVDPATLVGTDAADFELGLAAQGTVVGADPGPVSTLAEARIRRAVDSGFRLVEDSIVVDPGIPIVAGSSITFPVTVRASEVRIVDANAILKRIRGLGLPQARTVLREFGQAEITVWPDWVTSIPTSESRATLTIVEPGAPSASPDASQPAGSSP